MCEHQPDTEGNPDDRHAAQALRQQKRFKEPVEHAGSTTWRFSREAAPHGAAESCTALVSLGQDGITPLNAT